ncbi:MAG: EAL domain-containing protein [Motiliproteus sp.]
MRFVSSLIIGIGFLILSLILEQTTLTRHKQQQQFDVIEQLSVLRAQLEGTLNADLHLLSGLSATISINPDISAREFNQIAAKLMENRHDLRNIAGAPDLVIRFIHPTQGNETALGLDYNKNEQQRDAALKARDLNTMLVAGPLNLVQGGTGLIARLPVFYTDTHQQKQFWGIVSSVLDSDKIFERAGISDRHKTLQLAIRGKDSKGPDGDTFFGKADLFNPEFLAVMQSITLPYGSWQLAAIPVEGWQLSSPYRWSIRAGCLVLALITLLLYHRRNNNAANERRRQETFLKAFEQSPLGVAISIPATGTITNSNRSLYKIAGMTDEELPKLLPESITSLLADNQLSDGQEATIIDAKGDERVWRCFRSVLQTTGGDRLLTLFQDITERHDLLKQLQLSKQVIDHTSDAVVITAADTTIIEVNEAFSRITGYSREDALGGTPRLYRSNHHEATFYSRMWQQINEQGCFSGEIWNRSKAGELFPAWVSINRVGSLNDPNRQYIGVFSDISNIKQAEKDLERIAYYDPLTSLPNRALFHDRLLHEITNCRRHGHRLALLFLDLDRFKHVNDSFGHSIGDELLKVIAERLVAEVRENDTVTRLGGDEFTIIVSELTQVSSITSLVERILEQMQAAIPLAGHQLHVGASIGIALYPEDGEDAETLIQHADMAMYQAKEQGRNAFNYFTPALQERASSRLMLENQIRSGLENQQFELYYQPKLELHSRRVLGMEALIRWNHPDSGLIMPNDFIPVAEESGLIEKLGHWVLEQACRQTQQWHLQGFSHLRVAVNLSARQFSNAELVDDISQILQQTGLPADALELEITESMVVDNSAAAVKTLDKLRALGVEISIDDFGTGYSNLQCLKQFPLNSLKIDRSFVRDLTTDREDAAIVRAIILMSRGLGLNVIAEGIETQEQLDFLMENHCPMGQGYLFSKPLTATQFTDWIDSADLDFGLFNDDPVI